MKRRAVLQGAAGLSVCAFAQGRGREGPLATDGASFMHAIAECRLIDVLAPSLAGDPAERHAEASRAALEAIIASGDLELSDAAAPDRWGRRVVNAAVAYGGAKRSVQELLAAGGAVRVRPESGDRDAILRLLGAEAQARAARRGLWAEAAYAIRPASGAWSAIGAFHLVEGEPVAALIRKGRAYVNFGEDYRNDFTATARSRDARRWKKSGLDIEALAGSRVRVRGHVALINGPSIELQHPMQLELLPAAAG